MRIAGRVKRGDPGSAASGCLSGLSGAPTSLNPLLLMPGSHPNVLVKSYKHREQ